MAKLVVKLSFHAGSGASFREVAVNKFVNGRILLLRDTNRKKNRHTNMFLRDKRKRKQTHVSIIKVIFVYICILPSMYNLNSLVIYYFSLF